MSADTLELLRDTALFAGVGEDGLAELAASATEAHYAEGERLWEEGDMQPDFQMLTSGAVEWSRNMGGEHVVLAVHEAPSHFGAITALSRVPPKVTARAVRESTALRFPGAAFRALCRRDDVLLSRVVQLVGQVVSGNEGALRERERLASIGTLAAGLAHEINNPAAAALSQAAALREVLGPALVAPPDAAPPADALALADREEALADWLVAAGVAAPWDVAGTLAGTGATPEWCARVGVEALPAAAAALAARGLLDELDDALGRIVRLVGTMRDYANLDRTPEQDVDVAAGVRAAAVVVGVDVALDEEPGVPRVSGFPGELNQLWTALLRNACEADGTEPVAATVRRSAGGGVHVELADRGPGIPAELLARVWEPFFSTRPGNAGLGLDLVRRVVDAHRGRVVLGEREGGGTVVSVELPA